MPSAIPAMKGKFGSTEYYLVTMPAKELSEKLVIPKELDEWDDMSIEERFQRDVNYSRVKKHIAPYLAHDPDRFFGAFIVDIYNNEGVEFEPIESIASGLPKLYQSAGKVFGFLNFTGNEVLVPLDGQHRLASIRFAISGKDEKGKDINGLSPNLEVANDLCTVILVKHDERKARKIFNKVNRYAKSTSKADNLITADDDIIAVVTREEVADKIIHQRLVNFQSNTLSPNAPYFTTLSTLYEGTTLILQDTWGKIDTTVLPDAAKQKLYRDAAREEWQRLCERVHIFSAALHDANDSGDEKRREIRQDFLLGKPVAQLALVDAYLRLRTEREDGSRLSPTETLERINEVNWRIDNPMWQDILMKGNKIVAGKQAVNFAARFIAYYLGAPMQQKEVEVLSDQFAGFQGEYKRGLPVPLY